MRGPGKSKCPNDRNGWCIEAREVPERKRGGRVEAPIGRGDAALCARQAGVVLRAHGGEGRGRIGQARVHVSIVGAEWRGPKLAS